MNVAHSVDIVLLIILLWEIFIKPYLGNDTGLFKVVSHFDWISTDR